MEIIVKGSPQEVASFIVELQECADVMMDEIEQALEAVNDTFDEAKEKSPNTANEQAFLVAAERIKAHESLKMDNIVLQMLANMQQFIYADLIDMARLLVEEKEKTLPQPTMEMLDAMSAYAASLECFDKIEDTAFLKNESVKDEKEALLNVVQNSIQLQNSIYAILIQQ